MPVVAVCPVHGAFSSRLIGATNTIGMRLSNNSEPCPNCGRSSAVMDGVYSFNADGFATALSAPGWSRRALQSVQGTIGDLVEAVQADNPDRFDEVMQRLERQDQQLAHLVTAGIANKPPRDAVALLTKVMAVLGGIVTLREAGGLTAEAVHLIVREFFS